MNQSYRDTQLSSEKRAELLLQEMNIEEKLAQLTCFLPAKDRMEEVKEKCKNGIGEISTLEMRNIESLEAVADFQRDVQKIIMEQSRHHIPAIFHMEGLCGAFIQEAASFPAGIARGSSWDVELEEKIAKVVSRQERAVGITHTLAPVLDVARDPRMGRQGESYGEDAALVSAMGAAYTRGIQQGESAGRKSEAVAKHFLGSHHTQGGIHGTHLEIPDRLLREVYAKPFQAAISESGLKGIMPCYCSLDGEPASASAKLLTGLLRDEMKFDGVTVSDYSAISNIHEVQHVCESYTDAGEQSLLAGMDVETPNRMAFNDELLSRLQNSEKGIKRLDEAVLGVLAAKFRMGLFENPYALNGQELKQTFLAGDEEEIALQAARESLILLKNNGILPLKGGIKKIAVIGCHAENARVFFGDYTHLSMASAVLAVANSIAGIGESGTAGNKDAVLISGTQVQSDETEEFMELLKLQKPNVLSLLDQLKKDLPNVEFSSAYGYPAAGSDESGYGKALEIAAEADLVIMTLGGRYCSCSIATMGEGVDSSDINLPECQEHFIREAAKLGKPMVGVHFNGRPISSDAADECLDAILEAWAPAEGGAKAISEVLLGAFNPCGKLPVSVAYHTGQLPVYYNHPWGSAWHTGRSIGFQDYVDLPHTPRYCFGYGMSYTQFEYSALHIQAKEVSPDETIMITCEVKNTGSVDGTEVVQLYISDSYAGLQRPVKELAGFARVTLMAGEKKQVKFTVEPGQLAFLDKDMRWKIEAGEFRVMIGSSSEDIHLEDCFAITDSLFIEGNERGFYAKAEG